MEKKLTQKAKDGVRKIQQTISQTVRREGIFPFTERPSDEKMPSGQKEKGKLNADDLFSLFTADIIKKDVIFTR